MYKVLITTVPFGESSLEALKREDIKYVINPFNRKMTEDELISIIHEYDIVIAGTDPITKPVLRNAKKLKMISRVGIGLNSVDLNTATDLNIKVSYTPDGPSPAVAELAVNLMLSLLRSSHLSNEQLHKGVWKRILGRRLGGLNIGIIGFGRIGKAVYKIVEGFRPSKIMINEVNKIELSSKYTITEFCNKDKIYQESDIISIHLPLMKETKNMISYREMKTMKSDAIIVNTSRGGIINEEDLYSVLQEGHLGGVALDVFENEPYDGKLKGIEKCLLTAHIGPMTKDCRTSMEIQAIEEVLRFIDGEDLISEVPNHELKAQLNKR